MTHSKAMTVLTQLVSNIPKLSLPSVFIQINTGEITDHHEIQIRIPIPIHPRGAIRSATPFDGQARIFGGIHKPSCTVIQ